MPITNIAHSLNTSYNKTLNSPERIKDILAGSPGDVFAFSERITNDKNSIIANIAMTTFLTNTRNELHAQILEGTSINQIV